MKAVVTLETVEEGVYKLELKRPYEEPGEDKGRYIHHVFADHENICIISHGVIYGKTFNTIINPRSLEVTTEEIYYDREFNKYTGSIRDFLYPFKLENLNFIYEHLDIEYLRQKSFLGEIKDSWLAEEKFKRIYFDEEGKARQEPVKSNNELLPLLNDSSNLFKIEGMENYSLWANMELTHVSDVFTYIEEEAKLPGFVLEGGEFLNTAHLFIGDENARSFDMHTDPYLTTMIMIKGDKETRFISGSNVFIMELDYRNILSMAPNLPHSNKYLNNTIMLSVSQEAFLETAMFD